MTTTASPVLPESTEQCDVVVIGGGPAGSATALRLAARGLEVIQLERRTFYAPRHDRLRSGEGMVPRTMSELAALGVDLGSAAWRLGAVRHLLIRWPTGRMTYDDFPGTGAITLIDRECFDAMLFGLARRWGVDGRQGWHVQQILQNESGVIDGVLAKTPSGAQVTIRATLVVDAGGRNARSITQFGLRHTLPDPQFLVIARYLDALPDLVADAWETHFFGDTAASVMQITQIEPGLVRCALGTTLANGTQQGGPPDHLFQHYLQQYPDLRARLASSHQVRPTYARAMLAYAVRQIALPGMVLVGDATGYLNPLLGDGIWSALRSAALASTVVERACRTGDVSVRHLEPYVRRWTVQRRVGWLVTRLLVRTAHYPTLLLAPAYSGLLRRRLLGALLRA